MGRSVDPAEEAAGAIRVVAALLLAFAVGAEGGLHVPFCFQKGLAYANGERLATANSGDVARLLDERIDLNGAAEHLPAGAQEGAVFGGIVERGNVCVAQDAVEGRVVIFVGLKTVNGRIRYILALSSRTYEGRVFSVDDSDNVAQVFTLTYCRKNSSSRHDWLILSLFGLAKKTLGEGLQRLAVASFVESFCSVFAACLGGRFGCANRGCRCGKFGF